MIENLFISMATDLPLLPNICSLEPYLGNYRLLILLNFWVQPSPSCQVSLESLILANIDIALYV